MIELGAIRADEIDFPLFVHVLGSMVMVGGLLLAASVLTSAWRDGSVSLTRLGHRALLMAVLPAWLVSRVFAQITFDKPAYDALEEDEPAWVGIGFITSELGLLLIIGATVATGLGVRRATREGGTVGTSGRVAGVLVWLLVVAYVIAIWAMTTKPD